MPAWYVDCPELLPGEEFYIIAFWDLSTERGMSGSMIGSIPWSKAREYARVHGVDPSMLDPFWRIIAVMDDAYLGYQTKQYARHSRAAAKSAAPRTPRARGGMGHKR